MTLEIETLGQELTELWSFEKRASSCLKNEGADMATIHSGSIGNRLPPPL
jgi:hypothetical protein